LLLDGVLLMNVDNVVSWKPFDAAEKAKQEDLLTNTYVEALRKLAPDMGAYINEVYLPLPNP
jgi:hypothetical protein